jgi:tetratricopeptide (TPR) repeat protein
MGDRAVYCARLESVCAERHPGFESPPIRHAVCLAVANWFGKDLPVRLLISFLFFAALSLRAASVTLVPGSNPIEIARSYYQAGNFDGALAALDQFDQSRGKIAESLDLRGAIYMERGQLDEAARAFRAAHEVDHALFSPRIHLGEALFREKKYTEARDVFESLLRETNILISSEQLRYALLLTYLAARDDTGARAALDRIKFPTQTPAYYYAQAAWEFAHDRKSDAQKWIKAADGIFDAKTGAWFARPLYDFGWLKKKPMLAAP